MSKLPAYLILAAALTGVASAQDAATPPTAIEGTSEGETTEADAIEMPVVEVVGTPDRKAKLPGSAQVIGRETLEASHVMTTNEALRKAAGVNVRDEEGLGLRPNIGIRGLNPTRSTKVLLLEDGIPLAFAPYGDNASYYHPPVERFDRIEILKGAGQNIYGPQTVGGVINYITPAPPEAFTSGVRLTGGSREYFNGHGFVGGDNMVLDYVRKQGDAARDNTHSKLNDVNAKGVFALGGGQALTARANYYSEDSQLTYSGLTDAEYASFGRDYNPFENDEFKADRQGASLTHEMPLGEATLMTSLYGSRFNRDWWRQSSTTTDGQCNAVTYDTPVGTGRTFQQARADGYAVDPDDCNANIGNLREYLSYGLEPRLTLPHAAFGAGGELQAGVRVHFEEQDRIGQTGSTPDAREGVTNREDKERSNDAYSAFVQNRFAFGTVALIPALRVEHIRYEITNRCPNPPACDGAPVTGDDSLTEWVPSLGATWSPTAHTTVFTGAHRGFAPPTTGDLVDETTGASRELDAEQSWNYELGVRTRPLTGLAVEATAFLNDFERQIAVGSIAGGSTPLATGATRYEGMELLTHVDLGQIVDSAHNPFMELAYTWLPTADQEKAFTRVDNGTVVPGSAAGNRLPYAPEHLLTAALGYQHHVGVDTRLEAVYVGSQYADFANTEDPAAGGTGQSGEIASYTIWNAAVSYQVGRSGVGLFLAAKNVFDKVYIVDRTRGILPGAPRLVQAGVEYTFR
jgi:Fe(3+) dicitrate transport protein